MPQTYGGVQRVPPAASADAVNKLLRTFRGGELYTLAADRALAAAMGGGYEHATNPTPGTGIALSSAARATFAATEAALLLRNTSNAPLGPILALDFIRLICTAAGTAGVSADFICAIENANRYSSGGTALTPTGAASDLAPATVADVRFGNVTLGAAGGGVKYFGRTRVKTQAAPCWTVGDEVLLLFGRDAGEGSAAVTGAGPLQICKLLPPAILGPNLNHSFALHYWATSQSAAPSFEVEAGWYVL